jgi:hypothetical protein
VLKRLEGKYKGKKGKRWWEKGKEVDAFRRGTSLLV